MLYSCCAACARPRPARTRPQAARRPLRSAACRAPRATPSARDRPQTSASGLRRRGGRREGCSGALRRRRVARSEQRLQRRSAARGALTVGRPLDRGGAAAAGGVAFHLCLLDQCRLLAVGNRARARAQGHQLRPEPLRPPDASAGITGGDLQCVASCWRACRGSCGLGAPVPVRVCALCAVMQNAAAEGAWGPEIESRSSLGVINGQGGAGRRTKAPAAAARRRANDCRDSPHAIPPVEAPQELRPIPDRPSCPQQLTRARSACSTAAAAIMRPARGHRSL